MPRSGHQKRGPTASAKQATKQAANQYLILRGQRPSDPDWLGSTVSH